MQSAASLLPSTRTLSGRVALASAVAVAVAVVVAAPAAADLSAPRATTTATALSERWLARVSPFGRVSVDPPAACYAVGAYRRVCPISIVIRRWNGADVEVVRCHALALVGHQRGRPRADRVWTRCTELLGRADNVASGLPGS